MGAILHVFLKLLALLLQFTTAQSAKLVANYIMILMESFASPHAHKASTVLLQEFAPSVKITATFAQGLAQL